MNKKIIFTFIILISAFSLAGCGSSDSSYENSPYRHVLNDYVLLAENGYNFGKLNLQYAPPEVFSGFSGDLEYAHVKIDGGDIPALIIATVDHEKFEAAGDDQKKIEDSYTIYDVWLCEKGETPKYLVMETNVGKDSKYWICKDGYIKNSIAEGENITSIKYFHYGEGYIWGFTALEGAFHDSEKYYGYTISPENDPKEIPEKEFNELCNKHPLTSDIEWHPILTEDSIAIAKADAEKLNEIYEPVKEDYRKQIEKILTESKDGSTDGIENIDLMFTSNYDSADGNIEGSKDFSTAYDDIDTNGTRELLVFAGGELNAIWTHDGEKAVKLLDLVGTGKDSAIMRFDGISKIFIGGCNMELIEGLDESMGAGVYDPYRYYDDEYFVYSIQNNLELNEHEYYKVENDEVVDKDGNYISSNEWIDIYMQHAYGDDVEMVWNGGNGEIDPDYKAYDGFNVTPLF